MVIKIPYELPADRYVRAIEFVPGNRKLLHHMNGHIVQYDDKKKDPSKDLIASIAKRSQLDGKL